MHFLLRLLVTAAALWVALRLVPGLRYSGSWPGLLGVALVFGFLNAIVRPILFLLTCPLMVVTLGLFVFVLNAIMLLLTSRLAGSLGLNFQVDGFASALLGAIVIGITSALLNIFVGDKPDRPEQDRS
ncbi:MAG: phage holin family protein [Longimicrobiales bacterium]